MKKLLNIVTQHHQQFADKSENTRVIIFSQVGDYILFSYRGNHNN